MEKSNEKIIEQINLQKDFFKSRTEFYKTAIYCIIVSFFIGGSCWIFYSADFVSDWSTSKLNTSVIINMSYYLFSFIIPIILYFFKITKEDLIIYSVSFNSFIITNNLCSFWLTNNSTKLILFRILISFVVAFLHLFITIFIASLFRNLTLKKVEYWSEQIKSYNNGEIIDSKKEFKVKKKIEYYEFLAKKREQKEKLIKEALEERTVEEKEKLIEINNKILEKDKKKTVKEKRKLEKRKKKIKF